MTGATVGKVALTNEEGILQNQRVGLIVNKDEKRVPDKIKQKLDNYFNEKEGILSEDILDDSMIKDDLGLSDLNSFSNIRIPLIFQLKVKNVTTLIDKYKQ